MTTHPLIRDSLLDAAAILLPVRCAGCRAPDRSLCAACEHALRPRIRLRSVDGVPVWSALEYGGVPRRVLLGFKDAGRMELARPLGRALHSAIAVARAESSVSRPDAVPRPGTALLPVLVPSTRAAWRRRGYHPTRAVLARAQILVPPLWRALRAVRQTADQASLGASERADNRSGSLVGSARLAGRDCLIVDDILTTGATITEAARAIRAAGGHVAGAATIAHTPLRHGLATPADGVAQRTPG
jgi:predicted amidophosphoribosyltransferase